MCPGSLVISPSALALLKPLYLTGSLVFSLSVISFSASPHLVAVLSCTFFPGSLVISSSGLTCVLSTRLVALQCLDRHWLSCDLVIPLSGPVLVMIFNASCAQGSWYATAHRSICYTELQRYWMRRISQITRTRLATGRPASVCCSSLEKLSNGSPSSTLSSVT